MSFGTNTIHQPINEYESSHSLTKKNPESVQRSRFSKEEDEILKQLVNSQPHPKWSEIARCLNNRTARQCRERYNNYLRPNLVNGPWSNEEDKLLLELYERHGPKWSLISQNFDSRSSVNVKNHYSTLVAQKSTKTSKIDNKSDIKTNENNNSFIIEIKQRVNYEIKQVTEPKIVNDDINQNNYSFTEDDYSIGDETGFIMEDNDIGNILSNLEINDDLWSFPISSTTEEELFIF